MIEADALAPGHWLGLLAGVVALAFALGLGAVAAAVQALRRGLRGHQQMIETLQLDIDARLRAMAEDAAAAPPPSEDLWREIGDRLRDDLDMMFTYVANLGADIDQGQRAMADQMLARLDALAAEGAAGATVAEGLRADLDEAVLGLRADLAALRADGDAAAGAAALRDGAHLAATDAAASHAAASLARLEAIETALPALVADLRADMAALARRPDPAPDPDLPRQIGALAEQLAATRRRTTDDLARVERRLAPEGLAEDIAARLFDAKVAELPDRVSALERAVRTLAPRRPEAPVAADPGGVAVPARPSAASRKGFGDEATGARPEPDATARPDPAPLVVADDTPQTPAGAAPDATPRRSAVAARIGASGRTWASGRDGPGADAAIGPADTGDKMGTGPATPFRERREISALLAAGRLVDLSEATSRLGAAGADR